LSAQIGVNRAESAVNRAPHPTLESPLYCLFGAPFWIRRAGLGIKEGATVGTDDTVYMGFGVEGITNEATRNAIMDRVLDYLLR
jgi:hypothetical protein